MYMVTTLFDRPYTSTLTNTLLTLSLALFSSSASLLFPESVRITRQPRSILFGYSIAIRLPGTAAELSTWLNKKIIFYSVCSVSSSVGFAIGMCFFYTILCKVPVTLSCVTCYTTLCQIT